MKKLIEKNKVPHEVLNVLAIQNLKKFLPTNYCDYYPRGIETDEFYRYRMKEDGTYTRERFF